MDYKTPGVFIEEVSLFPPSVAGVATGIPAFVGHTEVTLDSKGNSLINKPTRITSLLEFTALFGGPYNPASYTVQVDPAANFNILTVTTGSGNMYYLFDAMRHYFDNGGGPCYIVTVGNYDANIIYGTDTTGLRGGLRTLTKVDEPTILVVPDSVALKLGDGTSDFVQIGVLHTDIIDQCARLQDRFAVLDIADGHLPLTGSLVQNFYDGVGAQNLNYAATYYPWLHTTYLKNVSFTQLNFIDNQVVPAAILPGVLDTMTGNAVLDSLLTDLRFRLDEERRVFLKVNSINRSNYNLLSTQFKSLRDIVMAANTAVAVRPAFANVMTFVRQLALAFRDVENDVGNSAELTQAIQSLATSASFQAQLTALVAFEKNTGVMNSISTARLDTDVDADYLALDNLNWINTVALSTILSNGVDYTNGGANTVAQTAKAAVNSIELQTAFDTVADAFISLGNEIIFFTDQVEKNLFAKHPFFKAVYDRIRKDMSLLPPSGAIAGVYAATDRSRGVWKAPANVSLRSVIAPAYKLTDQEQGELNIHSTGKSINGIRAFTGKGIVVWGARTLAGNDNEWRYINVRRFFTFVEESTKKASEPFVFESNDANTWIRIRAMIENFLTIQWRQGALAGSTAKQAFFVRVGLGETMTAQDILEGRLIVEIGLAAVRPAEFIILRFSHKMQES